MAVKKSELYTSLRSSCDELRGGMDASQYKDYVLTLLFIKYVTDRFKGDPDAQIEIPEKGGSFDDLVEAKGRSDLVRSRGLGDVYKRQTQNFLRPR